MNFVEVLYVHQCISVSMSVGIKQEKTKSFLKMSDTILMCNSVELHNEQSLISNFRNFSMYNSEIVAISFSSSFQSYYTFSYRAGLNL